MKYIIRTHYKFDTLQFHKLSNEIWMSLVKMNANDQTVNLIPVLL